MDRIIKLLPPVIDVNRVPSFNHATFWQPPLQFALIGVPIAAPTVRLVARSHANSDTNHGRSEPTPPALLATGIATEVMLYSVKVEGNTKAM